MHPKKKPMRYMVNRLNIDEGYWLFGCPDCRNRLHDAIRGFALGVAAEILFANLPKVQNFGKVIAQKD